MLEAFKKHISSLFHHPEQKRGLLAISGGIDSIVMAELYRLSGYNIVIAHCNFRLRGKESRGDEAFVWHYAKSHKIPFHVKHFDTKEYAAKHKLSLQMAARELRYKWLKGLCEKHKYNYLSIAHNSDDAIETFFINLLRGTGIAGLHGIASQQGNIIRPLLGFSRKEIEAFAKKNKIKWREDSSNASDKYERNKIRHHLIPLLEKLQPNARKAINLTIENIGEAEAIYRKAINTEISKLIEEKNGKLLISLKELRQLDHATIYLYEALKEYGFNYSQAKEIAEALDSQPGKIFLSSTHRIILDRMYLIIDHLEASKLDTKNVIEKSTKGIKTKTFKLGFSAIQKKPGFKPPVSPQIACLDYDKLEFPLTIRKWEKGDKFYPLGMDKPKKLSDFLIDTKVSMSDKEQVSVLISGHKIAWIIGYRIDNRFKIAPATKKLYICNIELIQST